MRQGLAILGALALLSASAYLFERFVRRSPLRFIYLTNELAGPAYDAMASKPGWSKASVQAAPGVKLNGLLRRPQAADAPWLLFYPGNDSTMLARGQGFLTKLAQDRDWGLAVFSYRGFDSSGGTPELDDLANDASAILEHVVSISGTTPARLHVIGFSIGGHLAVRAVAAANLAKRPAASLTLLASVNDIVMIRRAPWQKLALGDAYRTQPFLADVPAPVLVLQGTADEALNGPGQGRDISSALGQRARYQELEGVGHEALLDREPALQLVRDFISKP
jgi:pimeloyl-ACP methyl ester carboxylesterase